VPFLDNLRLSSCYGALVPHPASVFVTVLPGDPRISAWMDNLVTAFLTDRFKSAGACLTIVFRIHPDLPDWSAVTFLQDHFGHGVAELKSQGRLQLMTERGYW
jgi:hypothetical protein